ncbi:NUDIX hydrolase [Xylophilus sp. ASV27]|uniref:NUDIX hydrolase n=1 Tax=Xylophilus sp. ASV27 TaxID=2795129 RepID=UPI0018ED2DBB
MNAPGWVTAARAQARRGPGRAREPFLVEDEVVGSVDAEVWSQISLQPRMRLGYTLSKEEYRGAPAWVLRGLDASGALHALAHALRDAGHCGPWRGEQLAVCDAAGRRIGIVERGAVRVLGVATQAVHLLGLAPDGRMWVQQRAFDKPNHPGLWDTLMGGMVSAADTREQALARETWEEAGLRIDALQALAHGGHVDLDQPSDEAGGRGHMRERIDWYRATVPQHLQPVNQDGEVARFELLPRDALLQRLEQGMFTPEATLVLAAALGW